MSNRLWMPLYIADYRADTAHLSAAQHGAYLLLLMHYWRNGPLPDDDAQLAMIAKTETKAWRTVSNVIRPFFTSADGKLHQKRMDAERARADSISNTRSEAGKAGAGARWRNGKPPDKPGGKPIANAMANASQTDWQVGRQTDAPLQSHKDSLSSEESVAPRARANQAPSVSGTAVGNVVELTAKALHIRAYPPGARAKRSLDEQIAAVAKAPVRSAFLSAEQIATARQQLAARRKTG